MVVATTVTSAAIPKIVQETPSLKALVIGGGPEPKMNQVAIESNVRYFDRSLPKGCSERVLFADGDPKTDSVLYRVSGDDSHETTAFRKPHLPRQDGPSRLDSVKQELTGLAANASQHPHTPVFLYFTGHGSLSESSEEDLSQFDLWDDQELTVTDLAPSIESFPKDTPITLVMVQCHSGGFANLIFKGGNPRADLTDHQVAGFFASVPERVAAGCTSAVNEAEYRDFTSFFFAALTGTDRIGRKIQDADYNHDGKVEMDEAFAYTLIHDDSVDTPVCTSDAFVRRYTHIPDQEVFRTPYASVLQWASSAQQAALEALSADLKLDTDDRLEKAYRRFSMLQVDDDDQDAVYLIRFVRLAKSVVLAHEVRTNADPYIRRRFSQLIVAEHQNPLRP